MTTVNPEIAPAATDSRRRLHVEAELERILQSPGFRTSKRSQEFLRYIVSTSLDGRFDELRERVIGFQVFQRLPDYDTGEHSIVRVKANELRKRLAQFYSEQGEQSVVQIHLPKGSYTPEYRWLKVDGPDTVVQVEEKAAVEAGTRTWLWAICGLALVSLLGVVTWHFARGMIVPSVVERFWQPVLRDGDAPILCVGSPEIWKLNAAPTSQGALPPTIPSSEFMRDVDHYVGWGDAVALTQLRAFFAQHDKDASVRLADDVSFSELSHSPVVLIGARSNSWTLQLANSMRYVFDRSDGTSIIRDKTTGKVWNFQPGTPSTPSIDYVVLSRIFESKTGSMVVLAAGLSHYGTEAAGKILTDSSSLQKALRNAPKDWPTRNLQLVFRVEVFGKTAGEPTLEGSNFW